MTIQEKLEVLAVVLMGFGFVFIVSAGIEALVYRFEKRRNRNE